MSEEGEKTCPLCAEEMDLTDQQLKPCKCGYEICVWCWHHIMDMAEKDESEGRCPACRTPYDKEKIVRATSSCDRHVLEMNMEKKPKSSRGKNKSSEGRKQLANVRVIQKNLVYVVGLSLNMADEDLLQSREYFGQYGQVLKVSISRTASGALQQFANSTCSIYITYSKEEEAVRCIQSVHGFFLDGKPLKACFGTTKYCHAWLRNSPCSNPDCLYLHEIGSQEDSFTKDEIISAYKRVQQITGSTNSTQRRSGYVLPPPLDENYNNTSSGNTINKTSVNTNNTQIIARVSHPNSSAGRSAALPSGASRGTRVANNLPSHSSIQCSNWALKKPDVSDGLVTSSTAAVNQMRLSSLKSDTANILVTDKDSIVSQDKSETEASSSVVKELNTDEKATPLRIPNTPVHPTTLCVNKQSLGSSPTKLPAMRSSDVSSSLVSDVLSLGIDATDPSNGKMERMTHSHFIANSNQETQMLEGYVHRIGGTVTSQTSETTSTTSEDLDSRDAQSDSRFRMPRSRTPNPATQFDLCDVEDDLLSFENQRLKDPEVAPTGNNSSHDSHLSSHSDVNSTQHSKVDASKDYNIGESSIISNILSIDFDPWDESLTAPQNLAKLLGENDKQLRSFGVPGSWKTLNSNQSRFSFAREESKDEASGFVQSVDYFTKGSNQCSSGHEFFDGIFQLEKLDSRNGFPIFNGMESKPFTGNPSHTYSNRLSVLRPQVSSPPGFSVPNKTPPPGFTYHDRTNQIFDGTGNHLLDANMLRHQSPSADSTIINGEIEFIDPAILAVGKGLRLNNSRIYYSSHSNAHEEAKSQSILQRSLPSHRNQNVTNLGDSSSPLDNDTYSRVMEWNAAYHIPSSDGLIYNGQGEVWNERQAGNNLDMAEILRNERLWLYEYNGGYEDSKIRMPSSDNVFNGAMRILR